MFLTSAAAALGLLSTLGVVEADKTAADYYIHSLPGAPAGPLLKMHAGHIEVTPEHHGNLFFWHYQNRHIGDRQRTVIWLNGGPGCSSLDGALMEVGPYRVNKEGNLEYNAGSWDEFANVLFVDNPVGTGFSYVDTNSYLHELQEMSDNFIVFLEKWFSIFPEYEKDDLYIAGESYAGQHIPYIAKAILDHNKNNTQQAWNLAGLLIGNGWISPVDQYPAYLQFAYKSGLVEVGSDTGRKLESQLVFCKDALERGGKDRVDTGECEGILQSILRLTNDPSKGKDQSCVNMYDVRLGDNYPSCGMNWPPDLENVTPYLRRPDVVSALHINPDKITGWVECNGAVGSAFRAQHSRPSIELLPSILESVPITLFSGDQDLICNHVGTEELIHNMAWNGGHGFELSPGTWAPKQAWTFEDEPAGIYQQARNLTYVVFYNSSHMVPFDYPRRTRDMLDRFMGVDIASIGGRPTDSRIDGNKAGLETSVGGHPNSTVAEAEEADKLQQATWRAYYRAGEVALVIVAIAAAAWGYFVWKDRQRRAGYGGLGHGAGMGGMLDSMGFRMKGGRADLEASDFDEAELDKLEPPRSSRSQQNGGQRGGAGDAAASRKETRYDVGSDEDSDEEGDISRTAGR